MTGDPFSDASALLKAAGDQDFEGVRIVLDYSDNREVAELLASISPPPAATTDRDSSATCAPSSAPRPGRHDRMSGLAGPADQVREHFPDGLQRLAVVLVQVLDVDPQPAASRPSSAGQAPCFAALVDP